MTQDQPWQEIEHTADWALRVQGKSHAALFENAARGMASLVGGEADKNQPTVEEQFELSALDWETLLVDWLTELLYLIEDQHIVFRIFNVQHIMPYQMVATAQGKPGGKFHKHIKAATYHNLNVTETGNGYEATIVFDV